MEAKVEIWKIVISSLVSTQEKVIVFADASFETSPSSRRTPFIKTKIVSPGLCVTEYALLPATAVGL